MEAAEMQILRYVAGYTLWDKRRSDEMRSQLRMRKLDKQIHGRKKHGLEHLQRMQSERTPKRHFVLSKGRKTWSRKAKNKMA
jgi:hypothetical protein